MHKFRQLIGRISTCTKLMLIFLLHKFIVPLLTLFSFSRTLQVLSQHVGSPRMSQARLRVLRKPEHEKFFDAGHLPTLPLCFGWVEFDMALLN